MYTEARKEAGKTQEGACFEIHIGLRTLQNYEKGTAVPPPEVVAKMAEVYDMPELPINYCTTCCAIGKSYHYRPEENSLGASIVGLIKELGHVEKAMPELIDIADDEVIDDSEEKALINFMDELADLKKKIINLEYKVANRVSVVQMVQKHRTKEKAPAFADAGSL